MIDTTLIGGLPAQTLVAMFDHPEFSDSLANLCYFRLDAATRSHVA